MTRAYLKNDAEIELTLRRVPQARRVSLRVSRLDGRVTLTMPTRLPVEEALEFAESRIDWIRRARADAPVSVTVAPGAVIPIEGRAVTIAAATGRGVRCIEDVLEVRGTGAAGAVRAYLKTLARTRLAAASDRYADTLGVTYGRLTLRDTRSRWGSCSSAGHLMYSWRLIMAPPDVLDYVAAHEVAHLRHMDHSQAFWDTVASIYPDWKAKRDWLRSDGAGLHRYRFGD